MLRARLLLKITEVPKGEEYESNWIEIMALHFSVRFLSGILKAQRLEHWKLFVHAYAFLKGESVPNIDLQRTTRKLQKFCQVFEFLYSELLDKFMLSEHTGIIITTLLLSLPVVPMLPLHCRIFLVFFPHFFALNARVLI